MTTIDKIRAEIEAWIKDTDSSQFEKGERFAYNKVLGLLTTVEMSEKRVEFLDTLDPFLPSDVDEAAGEYERNNRCSVLGNVDIIDAFQAGAEWMKAKMMEGAVEADVITYEDLADGESDEERWVEFLVGRMPTNNLGDKVKIIVVKED